MVAARIGVLGATFDPVHLGHLAIAEEARERLGLGTVLFMPAAHPWMKRGRAITVIKDRVAMVRLAIQDNPAFSLSTVEAGRVGPTYTADTLRLLKRDAPKSTQYFLIMGMDALRELPRWHRPQEVIRLSRIIAFPRPGVRRVALAALEQRLPGITGRVTLLEGPLLGISATDIRRRVARGRSIRYLAPEAVVRYIEQRRLYVR